MRNKVGLDEGERRGNDARYEMAWPKLRGREGQALDGNTGAGLESGLVCRRCAVPGKVWARLGCWRQ